MTVHDHRIYITMINGELTLLKPVKINFKYPNYIINGEKSALLI